MNNQTENKVAQSIEHHSDVDKNCSVMQQRISTLATVFTPTTKKAI